jgi:hypothetical protein
LVRILFTKFTAYKTATFLTQSRCATFEKNQNKSNIYLENQETERLKFRILKIIIQNDNTENRNSTKVALNNVMENNRISRKSSKHLSSYD